MNELFNFKITLSPLKKSKVFTIILISKVLKCGIYHFSFYLLKSKSQFYACIEQELVKECGCSPNQYANNNTAGIICFQRAGNLILSSIYRTHISWGTFDKVSPFLS